MASAPLCATGVTDMSELTVAPRLPHGFSHVFSSRGGLRLVVKWRSLKASNDNSCSFKKKKDHSLSRDMEQTTQHTLEKRNVLERIFFIYICILKNINVILNGVFALLEQNPEVPVSLLCSINSSQQGRAKRCILTHSRT